MQNENEKQWKYYRLYIKDDSSHCDTAVVLWATIGGSSSNIV